MLRYTKNYFMFSHHILNIYISNIFISYKIISIINSTIIIIKIWNNNFRID